MEADHRWPDLRAAGVVYEDEHILALNKPPGISVTGERHGTDLLRTAADHGEKLWAVNRIDKVTSGLVLLAKSTDAHGPMTRQFAKRQAVKQYLAVVNANDVPVGQVRIDLPLRTASNGRVRVAGSRNDITYHSDDRTYRLATTDGAKHYPSTTIVERIGSPPNPNGGAAHPDGSHPHPDGGDAETTLVVVWPLTGRRHQIRVHLAWIGWPVAGDPLFRSTSGSAFDRTMLHSYRLALTVPWAEPPSQRFIAPPPSSLGLTHHQLSVVEGLRLRHQSG